MDKKLQEYLKKQQETYDKGGETLGKVLDVPSSAFRHYLDAKQKGMSHLESAKQALNALNPKDKGAPEYKELIDKGLKEKGISAETSSKIAPVLGFAANVLEPSFGSKAKMLGKEAKLISKGPEASIDSLRQLELRLLNDKKFAENNPGLLSSVQNMIEKNSPKSAVQANPEKFEKLGKNIYAPKENVKFGKVEYVAPYEPKGRVIIDTGKERKMLKGATTLGSLDQNLASQKKNAELDKMLKKKGK